VKDLILVSVMEGSEYWYVVEGGELVKDSMLKDLILVSGREISEYCEEAGDTGGGEGEEDEDEIESLEEVERSNASSFGVWSKK